MRFDGVTYEPDQDEARLASQLRRVFGVMSDSRWHTLAELAERTGGSEAGVSARLRDLRKPRFGHWTVERERVDGGLFMYRLPPGPSVMTAATRDFVQTPLWNDNAP